MTEYRRYSFSKMEWVKEGTVVILKIVLLGGLFFRSLWGCLLLLPYGVFLLYQRKNQKIEERKSQLREDFKEVMMSIAASLQAGYALEQTVGIAIDDMNRMGKNPNRPMMQELHWMKQSMELHRPIEEIFEDFAIRSDVEEIQNFSAILSIAKRQGGNLVRISAESAEHISRSIQVESEISQVLAGRNLEKNIMTWMPYFILLYLQITNPVYLQPLFEGAEGRIFMGICLLITLAAGFWAESIVRIHI